MLISAEIVDRNEIKCASANCIITNACAVEGNKGLQLKCTYDICTSFQNCNLKSVHNLVMSDYNYVAVMLYFSSKVAQTI